MAKVLVIYGTDGGIRSVPLANKAVLLRQNNLMPEGKKERYEEMEEEQAAKLPPIDPNFKTPAEKEKQAAQLAQTVDTQAERIAFLEAQLAAQNAGNTGDAKPETAAQLIEKINAAATPEEVKQLLGTDQRVTVIDAANKKLTSFNS